MKRKRASRTPDPCVPRAIRQPRRTGVCRGFTLLEVLVATTLTVVVLTAVYATFAGITAAVERSERVAETSQTARMVLSDVAATLARGWQAPDDLPSRNPGLRAAGPPATEASPAEASSRFSVLSTVAPAGSSLGEQAAGGIVEVSYSLEAREGAAGKPTGSPFRLVRQARVHPGGLLERWVVSEEVSEFQIDRLSQQVPEPGADSPDDRRETWVIRLALAPKGPKSRPMRFVRSLPVEAELPTAELPKSLAPPPVGSETVRREEGEAGVEPPAGQPPRNEGPGRPKPLLVPGRPR